MTEKRVESGERVLVTAGDGHNPLASGSSLREILDGLYTFVGVLTPQGTVVEANRAALHAASLTTEDVIGKRFEDTYWWSYSPEVQAQLRAAIDRAALGERSRYDVSVRVGADHFIDIDFALVPMHDLSGRVSHLVASGIDITERKRMEEVLREGQAQFASVIGSAMDAIITVDENQRVVLFNAAAEKMLKCAAEDAMGQEVVRFIPTRYRETHREHIDRFGSANVTKRAMGALGSVFGVRSDGEEFPIEASISHADVAGRKLYTVILRDITERKAAEDQLREQAALLDHAQDAIMVRDLEDRLLFWNRRAERIYGWKSDEVLGENICDLFYRENRDPYDAAKEALLAKGDWEGELRQLTRDGKEIIAECRWTLLRDKDHNPRSVLVINTDVTDKKKIEAQLLRAQRMESIGTLAGGIAHDINNLLSPILMSIRLLQLKSADEDSQRILATLQASVERGAGLVKQVLSFARGVQGDRILLQPRHLIREIVKILKDTLPKSIEVWLDGTDDLWLVSGDPTQLHQVMMNLCVNARDAMLSGGKLSITAQNVAIDENYARMNLEARAGRFVLITISDNGTGIPAQVVDKIFEPFFTTKEHGKGTGLGLSTALGIVKGHGGFINVYSEAGRGAQFKIYLPAASADQKSVEEAEEAKLPTGHGELILVVDDEVAILEITRGTLEAYGYRVLTAADGTEAVALFAQHRGEVRVVLTDMMMPFMDGPATIRALQKLDPRVQIIATSGFTDNGRSAGAPGVSVKLFLSKPYTADKLLRALADIIQAN
jgi:hypothetical protein